jgi:CDP-diacylglycerol--glycerol-3-phosphate 3-phosphatidyltransferase/cardiolipin synthase
MIIHPNKLTMMRIIAVPLIIICFLLDFPYSNWVCWGLFTIAGITDFLDGYLARKYKLESKLGAFLDPVADKLLVVLTLILLVSSQRLLDQMLAPMLFIIAVIIVAGREIFISALREWMAEQGKRDDVAVSRVGKFKTMAQMFAIGGLLLRVPVFGLPILQMSELLFYVAALLTLWSMSIYLRAAWPDLTS